MAERRMAEVIDGPKVAADGIPPDGNEHGRPEHAFQERLDAALGDDRLARNLTTFQQSWKSNRTDIMATVPFGEMRDSLKARKSDVIAHLDERVSEFEAAAERAGARVHHAATAVDANRIIRDLARLHSIEVIAKSKSMVSEEIELNHDFHDHGIEVVETDLGE